MAEWEKKRNELTMKDLGGEDKKINDERLRVWGHFGWNRGESAEKERLM